MYGMYVCMYRGGLEREGWLGVEDVGRWEVVSQYGQALEEATVLETR